MTCELHSDRLDAYVDESLPPEEFAAVENHLSACPSCTAEVLSRLQMKRAVRAAAASLASSSGFRMRPEFRQQLEETIQRKRRPGKRGPGWLRSQTLWLAPAAVALLLIAVFASMLTRRAASNQATAELLDLHIATIASANPVDVVSTDRHTVKPWFQGKIPFTFNLPELQGSQYSLLGGKLVYFEDRPAAQLLFELRKHDISVFIAQNLKDGSAHQSAVASISAKGFSVETWTQSGLSYTVIGDAGSADIHALGELLRTASR
jgi:anti-sigma factor RsiW